MYRPALGEICLATTRTSPPWPCIIVDPRRSTTPAAVSRDKRSRAANRVVVLFYETKMGLYDFPLLSSIIAYSSEPAVKSRAATVEKLRRLGTASSAKKLEEFLAACAEADADMLVPREERELVFVSDEEGEEGSGSDDDDDDDDSAAMVDNGAVDDDKAEVESSVAADGSRGVISGSRESAASAGAGAAETGAVSAGSKRARVESPHEEGGAGGLPARNVEQQQRLGRLESDSSSGGGGAHAPAAGTDAGSELKVRARTGALQLEVVGALPSSAADTAAALELRAAFVSGLERSDARALLSALTGPLCTRINLTFSILTETKLAEELKKLLKYQDSDASPEAVAVRDAAKCVVNRFRAAVTARAGQTPKAASALLPQSAPAPVPAPTSGLASAFAAPPLLPPLASSASAPVSAPVADLAIAVDAATNNTTSPIDAVSSASAARAADESKRAASVQRLLTIAMFREFFSAAARRGGADVDAASLERVATRAAGVLEQSVIDSLEPAASARRVDETEEDAAAYRRAVRFIVGVLHNMGDGGRSSTGAGVRREFLIRLRENVPRLRAALESFAATGGGADSERTLLFAIEPLLKK